MSPIRKAAFYLLAGGIAFAGAVHSARAGDELSTLLADGAGLSSNVLAEQRGGTDSSTTGPIASVTNNISLGDTVSGANSVANAFNNATGLITVLQNSGNNVAMQSQTIVNVNLQ